MGIRVTGLDKVMSKIDDLGVKVQKGAVDFLGRIGDRFCDVARETKTYQDITYRMSCSIGWGVSQSGRLLDSGGFGGGEGEEWGRQTLAEAVAADSDDNVSLHVVCGAEYAVYVERKGFVVFDNALLVLPSLISEISTSRLLELVA